MRTTLGLLLAAGAVAAPAHARPDDPEPHPFGSAVSGTLSATAATHYFFRGIVREDRDAIVQPALDLDFDLDSGGGTIGAVELTLGTWNSLHSGPTGSGSGSTAASPKAWFESDFYVGIELELARRVTLSATWVEYTSPNDLFTTISEVDVALALNDASFWGGGFALRPSLLLAFEVDDQADQNAAPPGTSEGVFLGIGVEPAFEIGRLGESAPLTLSIPIDAGFSLGDYYEDATGSDDFFGFADGGVALTVPLTCVPVRYGAWTLSARACAVPLGDNLETANVGDPFELTASVAVTVRF